MSSSYQPCVEERVNIYIFANYNFMQHFLPEVKVHKNNRILVGVIADDLFVAHNRCNVDKSQANLSATLYEAFLRITSYINLMQDSISSACWFAVVFYKHRKATS